MDGSNLSREQAAPLEYAAGASMGALAGKYGACHRTVREWILAAGISIRPLRGPEWTKSDDEQLTGLWRDKLSAAEIGLEMERTRGSIIGRAHRLKLPPRPSPIIRTGKPKPTIVRLREAIAKRYVVKVPKAANNGQKSVAARKANRMAEEAIKALPVIYDRDNGQQEPKGCLFIEKSLSDPTWGYCQATATEYGGSWCAEHRKRVFVCREVQVGEMKEAA